MTELLFKLKKAGKTVGLMKIDNGATWTTVTVCDKDGKLVGFDPSWDSAWCVDLSTGEYKPALEFDEAFPFVCKDRNGKDVFEGDAVAIDGNRRLVAWNEICLDWIINDGRPLHNIIHRIELIEDQP